MSEICIIVTIVVYLAAMLLVGFAYSKTNNDSADFYLGGRKMGPLVTAMSAEASDMSSWLLMGMPGLAYLSGIASPGWTAIGLALGTWLNWLIVARRLRRYSADLNAITVPQFLSLRFHDQRNLLNALGAVIIIVFFVPYTASGFAACGKLFHSLFGVDYMAAAGYRPSESLALWRAMAEGRQSGTPEFASTHPSDQTRLMQLQQYIASRGWN